MAVDYAQELNNLIEYVIREGGSDLHLSPGRPPTIRVSGSLIPLVKLPKLTKADTFGLIEKLLTPEVKKTFLEDKEMDFSYNHNDFARFRGNAFFQQEMVSIALRLIPKKIKSFSELLLPPILENFA
ncbi:MAG: type IV pili twitching motility protein PilT, partial [Patescibacteria group bacterium]